MEDSQVVRWVEGVVSQKIHERTDGVYLRSDPQVTIVSDQMKLHLSLGKKISVIGISADPTITIDAGFGLAVVPGTAPLTLRHLVLGDRPGVLEFPPKLAPVAKDIRTDCSFPWYVWLVPGAMIALPIAASGAEADAYRSADSMIDDIVDELLNGYFQSRPNTYKHKGEPNGA
jgi:hypothetical protein